MQKYVEQYQAWGGGLTRPIWTDVQGWHEGNFSITEEPGTSVPSAARKMHRSPKPLTASPTLPLAGG
jgi:hypothetical protein